MPSRPSPAYRASRGNGRTGYTPTKATTTTVVATIFDDEASSPNCPPRRGKQREAWAASLGGLANVCVASEVRQVAYSL